MLLDVGTSGDAILWIDPAFGAGDFGALWGNVPSNTRIGEFYTMYEACRAFEFERRPATFALDTFARDTWCDLRHVAEPLHWITARLRGRVASRTGFVERCDSRRDGWELTFSGGATVRANNVVLAVGAQPRTLAHPGVEPIPLEVALDRERLPHACVPADTVAVFGSSHSAILALRSLLEDCEVAGVVNFYRTPLRYTVFLPENRRLYDDTGLKGTTAQWARASLGGDVLPPKLTRCYAGSEEFGSHLERCTKAIYAIGFERRSKPLVDGIPAAPYDEHTGIIAPGLFGCGFGFPEAASDEFGDAVHRVGIIKFTRYIARVMPLWKAYAFTSASAAR
jgi:hypothetical protein